MTASNKTGSDKWVNEYISEVGTYSQEHIGHIEKMNSLLDSMKNSGKSSEKRSYTSFKETVDSFNKYLADRNLEMTGTESEKMTAILSSSFDTLVKKRMVEDIIHKIRDRIDEEKDREKEEQKKNREIEELRESSSGIMGWIHLTRFAMNYGTLTLFLHKLKSTSLSNIKNRALRAHYPIDKELKSILDDYYHYLSIMEYNAIVKLYDMGPVLRRIGEITPAQSYNADDISDEIASFITIYACVLKNSSYIEKGLKKVFKSRKPKHGFWGYVWTLIDKPLEKNRRKSFTEAEAMKKTIAGTLKSYYSALYKKPVLTMNQVFYIAGVDGAIDSNKKNYTPEAKVKVSSEEEMVSESRGEGKIRLRELENLTEKLLPMGEQLFERFFKLKAGSSISSWQKESEKRPFFKLAKVVDAFSRYLLDIIADSENTSVEHDADIKKNYFSFFPDLIKGIDSFHKFLMDIEGSKVKEVASFIIPVNEPAGDFISHLMKNEVATSITRPAEGIKPILQNMAVEAYNLSLRFNDMIKDFSTEGMKSDAKFYKTFDYYKNSVVLHPQMNSTAMALNQKEVILSDLIEASCALSFYIASFLCHHGVDAIFREIELLKNEINDHDGSAAGEDQDSSGVSGEEFLMNDLFDMYTDSLSGLKKIQYLEDVIFPKFYDEEGSLSIMDERYIFSISIVNLSIINERYGNDTGDRIFVEVASIVKDELSTSGNEDDVAFRSDGGIVYGFINGLPHAEAVDKMVKILTNISSIDDFKERGIPEDPVVNMGIMKERMDVPVDTSMKLVREIMMYGYDGKISRVVFPKNSNVVIDSRTIEKGRAELSKILTAVVS